MNSKRNLLRPFLAIVLIATPALFLGRRIPISVQTPLLDGLRNTSAVVFGIMGAWMSILYPGALSRISGILHNSNNSETNSSDEIMKARATLRPILLALIVSSITLALLLVLPIISNILCTWVYPKYAYAGRAIHFYLIALMSGLEGLTILYVIAPAFHLSQTTKDIEERQKLLERLHHRSKEDDS